MDTQAGNAVLKEVRLALGLKQRELAKIADLHPGYLCQIEIGTNQIGRDAALKIWKPFRRDFDRLGFTLEDLLRGRRTAVPKCPV